MDDFLDDLASEGRTGPECRASILLGILPPDRAAKLQAVIDGKVIDSTTGRRFTSASISKSLERSGIKLSEASIARHRRRGCRCPA